MSDEESRIEKTAHQRISALQGQVIALTAYLRAALDKHPAVNEAIAMAESELERQTATYLHMPFQDEMFQGIELVQKSFRRRKDRT